MIDLRHGDFIGIELDDKYFEIAKQRIENGIIQEKIKNEVINNLPLFL